MPQNKPQKNKSQSGNVFILILLGVFLFGALMYAFTRSANQGTGNLTKQQSKIAAQEIINYARLVEGAVDRVRRNGCSETEISFDNAVVAGYSNPNAPTDKSCDIFDDAGGKILYNPPQKSWINEDKFHANDLPYEFIFSGETSIKKIGTDCANSKCSDIIIYIAAIKKEVCNEINSIFNITIPTGGIHMGNFEPRNEDKMNGSTFTYLATQGIGDQAGEEGYEGKHTGCIRRNDRALPDYYAFYHVLLAR